MVFDIWVYRIEGSVSRPFVEQAGIWSHPHWSPADHSEQAGRGGSQIAFLQASSPLDGLRSSYSLWLMDADGSNTRRIYPQIGENSAFPYEAQFMAWGPSGRDMVFVFDNALYFMSVDDGIGYRVTQDDAVSSKPTWAPYGMGMTAVDAGSRATPSVNIPSSPPRPPQEEQ
jgi:Tol biopolymer transport system component